jgi:hypothetical protein
VSDFTDKLPPCRHCGATTAPLGEFCPDSDPDDRDLHDFTVLSPLEEIDAKLASIQARLDEALVIARERLAGAEAEADDRMQLAEWTADRVDAYHANVQQLRANRDAG